MEFKVETLISKIQAEIYQARSSGDRATTFNVPVLLFRSLSQTETNWPKRKRYKNKRLGPSKL